MTHMVFESMIRCLRLFNINVFKLNPEAKLPKRNLSTDCGLDLYAVEDVFIPKGTTGKIRTGIAMDIPNGYVGRISDRSGMASKGLIVGAGVIDPGYSGDFTVVLHNFSNDSKYEIYGNYNGYEVKKGDKIAQVLIYKVETPYVCEVNELWVKERGDTGWGSSDKK